ncbi:hypothetical protein DVA86_24585 [Streptomyces armeniacus]|uniref:Uncharacterized protein n=1 Tax=Streptomyces armeniacus TaxID=83291 RepID=A0A345XUN3_9ACTN|nr:hypothetical protein DVA86_24585 [Streptomyces armeniacus]
MPRPESVDEVAKWEDPDGLGRTELYYAPIFWVLLPLAALGYLIWGTVTDPGDGWTGNLLDDNSPGNLWNFWLVWAGAAVWLLIALGVLVFRFSLTSQVRADNEWIHQHSIPCSVHHSPYRSDDGEGGSWPTFIAIDHRTADEQATRIHLGLHVWLSHEGVRGELDSGSLRERRVISSTELFGEEAAGGFYLRSIPGFGPAEDFEAHRWVLLTEPRDGEGDATVTTVPRHKKLQKIRRRLRRKAARKSTS